MNHMILYYFWNIILLYILFLLYNIFILLFMSMSQHMFIIHNVRLFIVNVPKGTHTFHTMVVHKRFILNIYIQVALTAKDELLHLCP